MLRAHTGLFLWHLPKWGSLWSPWQMSEYKHSVLSLDYKPRSATGSAHISFEFQNEVSFPKSISELFSPLKVVAKNVAALAILHWSWKIHPGQKRWLNKRTFTLAIGMHSGSRWGEMLKVHQGRFTMCSGQGNPKGQGSLLILEYQPSEWKFPMQ